MTALADVLHMIVLPDNPDCWPSYDPAFVKLLTFDPKVPHPDDTFVRRAFETIDKDRWYLVANVYGHPSTQNGYSGYERYETVHAIPRPRRGARSFYQVRNASLTDRVWHHGMTYDYTDESSSAVPIGEPVPISLDDAYRYWEAIRIKLRLSEQAMERKGMPKPRRHVVEGFPYWWQTNTRTSGHPISSSTERVTAFRRAAKSASRSQRLRT